MCYPRYTGYMLLDIPEICSIPGTDLNSIKGVGRAAFLAVFLLFSLHSDFGRFQRAEYYNHENQKYELVFFHRTWTLMKVPSPQPSLPFLSKREYFSGNSQPAGIGVLSDISYFFQHCDYFQYCLMMCRLTLSSPVRAESCWGCTWRRGRGGWWRCWPQPPLCSQEGGLLPAKQRSAFSQTVSETFLPKMSSGHLARASLVLPRGGSRRPQVVITAGREGGLVNKA